MKNNDFVDARDDDGTMPNNVEELSDALVGHKIVSIERGEKIKRYGIEKTPLVLTLDNGSKVQVKNTYDCCAYTELEDIVISNLDDLTHMITGVVSSDGYETWHILADFGEVMQLKVGWSSGNPFYYGYGFEIVVEHID